MIILNLCARYNGLLPAHTVMIGSADANGDSGIFFPLCNRAATAKLRAASLPSYCRPLRRIARAVCSKGDPYKGCHRGRPDRIIRYYLLAPGSWTTGGGCCLDRDRPVTKRPAPASSFSCVHYVMSECVSLILLDSSSLLCVRVKHLINNENKISACLI